MGVPIVSVIVPVYNGERWVAACVRSVLNQTFGDFELILVNDGSTDGTAAVLDTFRADSRVRIHTQANQGVSVARNTGLDRAQGAYVYFLDSDDFIHPQLLERCVGGLRSDPRADFVCFDYSAVPENSLGAQATFRPLPKALPTLHRWEKPFEDFLATDRQVMVWRFCFRKAALEGLRFVPGLHYEDNVFIWCFMRRSSLGFYLPETLYAYRQTAYSLCRHPLDQEELRHYANVLREIVRDYAQEPERLKLLGQRQLTFMVCKITWKRALKECGKDSEQFALTRRLLGALLADGTLRLRWFPLKWRLRLICYRLLFPPR